MKKVLITGITGFAGQYLAEVLLKDSQIELHGSYFSDEGLTRITQIKDKVHLHKADLTKQEEVVSLLTAVAPDELYHLAAQTSPAESFKDPGGTITTNILSELYLFEAIKDQQLPTRVLSITSSEVYGLIKPEDLPVDEQTSFRPASPYSVSKIAQDYLSLQYFLSYKLPIIRVRPFNHTGPRQTRFVIPTFAKQIAEIERGKDPVMKVGNLKAKKDFSDVRDIVRAYVLLMEKGVPGEVYNVGSGKSIQIQQILAILLSNSDVQIRVEQDPALFRPVDIEDMVCDHTKLTNLTGWKPEISIEQTLGDVLDYWRKVV